MVRDSALVKGGFGSKGLNDGTIQSVICGAISPGEFVRNSDSQACPQPLLLRNHLCFNQFFSWLVDIEKSGEHYSVITSGVNTSCPMWVPLAAVIPGAFLFRILDHSGLWREWNRVWERALDPKSRPWENLNPGSLMQHLCMWPLLDSLSLLGSLCLPCSVNLAKLLKPFSSSGMWGGV